MSILVLSWTLIGCLFASLFALETPNPGKSFRALLLFEDPVASSAFYGFAILAMIAAGSRPLRAGGRRAALLLAAGITGGLTGASIGSIVQYLRWIGVLDAIHLITGFIGALLLLGLVLLLVSVQAKSGAKGGPPSE